MNVEEYGFEPQNHHRTLFLQLVFSAYCYYVFFLPLRNYNMFSYFLLFYFIRTMKIITGRRRLVLTEGSPTTIVDNSKLALFAGYYTRRLFPLSAFLNGVAGIHSSLINLNEIKTRVFEFFLACLKCDSLCHNIFSLHKNFPAVTSLFSNSKLTDPMASSGTPHSREMTDPQPGLNSEYLESETVSSKCRIVCVMSDCCLVEGLYVLIWLPLCLRRG